MFQNIACVLDDAITNNHSLPQHLQRPFREFIKDLNSVAHKHFECHVRGHNRPPLPYSTSTKTEQSANTGLKPQPKQLKVQSFTPSQPAITAATAIKSALPKQRAPLTPVQPCLTTRTQTRHKPKKAQEDNRLLVRVSSGHPALSMSPYAVMLQLNQHLGEKLIREIQVTKTGFAICPSSVAALESLKLA
ncbi:hypothetical protein EV44_g4150 [Erysiphe necator]|uniref:Uncharacterized protein n=1 Tax=Uncinula necator TaxID=52586 RepID=A0A0B1P6C2_UNCNE|nr:hypothetical protein EV44_g4150 [Erysiphe necator]